MAFRRRNLKIPVDGNPHAIRDWFLSNEKEARGDLAALFSQRLDGAVVDVEMARLLAGQTVSGKEYCWSTREDIQ
jgi:hypothetical protein